MKAQLRREKIQLLEQQDRNRKAKRDASLLVQLIATKAYQEARIIATYLSMDMEYDTQLFIDQALKDGKRVVVPKVLPQHQMAFLPYDRDKLVQSAFGVLEPSEGPVVGKDEIDLMHVPGVAFSQKGYRIGFGGGYYDRYLADFSGETVSTIYPFQLVDFVADAYDIPIKEVLISEE